MNNEYTGLNRSQVMKKRAVRKIEVEEPKIDDEAVNGTHRVYLLIKKNPGIEDTDIYTHISDVNRGRVYNALIWLTNAGYVTRKAKAVLGNRKREVYVYRVTKLEYKPVAQKKYKVAPNDKKALKSVEGKQQAALAKGNGPDNPFGQSPTHNAQKIQEFQIPSIMESIPHTTATDIPLPFVADAKATVLIPFIGTDTSERTLSAQAQSVHDLFKDPAFQEKFQEQIAKTDFATAVDEFEEKSMELVQQLAVAQAAPVIEEEVSSVIIMVEAGNKTLDLTANEARKLWKDLNNLFGK